MSISWESLFAGESAADKALEEARTAPKCLRRPAHLKNRRLVPPSAAGHVPNNNMVPETGHPVAPATSPAAESSGPAQATSKTGRKKQGMDNSALPPQTVSSNEPCTPLSHPVVSVSRVPCAIDSDSDTRLNNSEISDCRGLQQVSVAASARDIFQDPLAKIVDSLYSQMIEKGRQSSPLKLRKPPWLKTGVNRPHATSPCSISFRRNSALGSENPTETTAKASLSHREHITESAASAQFGDTDRELENRISRRVSSASGNAESFHSAQVSPDAAAALGCCAVRKKKPDRNKTEIRQSLAEEKNDSATVSTEAARTEITRRENAHVTVQTDLLLPVKNCVLADENEDAGSDTSEASDRSGIRLPPKCHESQCTVCSQYGDCHPRKTSSTIEKRGSSSKIKVPKLSCPTPTANSSFNGRKGHAETKVKVAGSKHSTRDRLHFVKKSAALKTSRAWQPSASAQTTKKKKPLAGTNRADIVRSGKSGVSSKQKQPVVKEKCLTLKSKKVQSLTNSAASKSKQCDTKSKLKNAKISSVKFKTKTNKVKRETVQKTKSAVPDKCQKVISSVTGKSKVSDSPRKKAVTNKISKLSETTCQKNQKHKSDTKTDKNAKHIPKRTKRVTPNKQRKMAASSPGKNKVTGSPLKKQTKQVRKQPELAGKKTQKRKSETAISPTRHCKKRKTESASEPNREDEFLAKQSAVVARHTLLSAETSSEGNFSSLNEKDMFSQLCRLEERSKEYDADMLQSLIPIKQSDSTVYKRPGVRRYSSSCPGQSGHMGGIWGAILSGK